VEIAIAFVLFVALALASLRWGRDTRWGTLPTEQEAARS
jgi:hypothetical protein